MNKEKIIYLKKKIKALEEDEIMKKNSLGWEEEYISKSKYRLILEQNKRILKMLEFEEYCKNSIFVRKILKKWEN